jgi:hypothetical protein
MPLPLAASFLAGAILTLVLPVGLLIAIACWHFTVVARVTQHGLPSAQPTGTPPPVTDEELPRL